MSEQKQVFKVSEVFVAINSVSLQDNDLLVYRISLLLILRGIEPRTERTKQRLPEPSLILTQSRIELQLLGWQSDLDIFVEDLAYPASELF